MDSKRNQISNGAWGLLNSSREDFLALGGDEIREACATAAPEDWDPLEDQEKDEWVDTAIELQEEWLEEDVLEVLHADGVIRDRFADPRGYAEYMLTHRISVEEAIRRGQQRCCAVDPCAGCIFKGNGCLFDGTGDPAEVITEDAFMVTYVARMDGVEEQMVAEDLCEAEDLAREWAQEGSWPEEEGRFYVTVTVEAMQDGKVLERRGFQVVVGSDPEPPECTHPEGHNWESPHEVLGGLNENPGVWQTRGTQVTHRHVCDRCGAYKVWTSESTPGDLPEEPEKTRYEEADEASLAWVQSEHGMTEGREETVREYLEPLIRKAIKRAKANGDQGEEEAVIPGDLFNLGEDLEITITAEKTREDGATNIDVSTNYDNFSEYGERVADFLDDLVEEVLEGALSWIREELAQRFAVVEE
jgi:hypothetical protein